MPDMTDTANLAAASAAAIEDLTSAAPATPEPTAPAAEPASPQGAVEPPQSASAPSPEDVLELKVRDSVEKLSISKDRAKLVELAQKGLDYTQKTQMAAEERRQIESYAQALAAREQQLAEFLRDPLKVTQYAQFLLSQQTPQAQAADPNAVVTTQELQQALTTKLQELQVDNDRKLAAAQFEIQVSRYQEEYESDLLKTAKSALEKYSVLDSSVESAEELVDVLKADLAKKGLQPSSIDEAKDAFLDLAKARAERLHSKFNDFAKMEAVRQAKVLKNAPEPPGGAAPAPQASHFKLGDPRLTAAAIADMEVGRR